MRLAPSLFAAAVLLAGCSKGKSDDANVAGTPLAPPGMAPAPVAIEATRFNPALNVNLQSSTHTPSGLYYRDITVGTGRVAASGDQVVMSYIGALPDGTVFDKSSPDSPTISFPLGAGQVVAGWDEGIVGMKVGGKRQLIVPPDLGYGAVGRAPVPGNAIMVFTVELVGIK
ncbi:MAG TPA: FKBP-type peptidyl-prolyl cis-trans isomerase [Gemmatimonadales bacterium]|jgi:FKBP-type peptidyl-prolyl cis-trans isomerase